MRMQHGEEKSFGSCTHLKNHVDLVLDTPRIKRWIEKRPVTSRWFQKNKYWGRCIVSYFPCHSNLCNVYPVALDRHRRHWADISLTMTGQTRYIQSPSFKFTHVWSFQCFYLNNDPITFTLLRYIGRKTPLKIQIKCALFQGSVCELLPN